MENSAAQSRMQADEAVEFDAEAVALTLRGQASAFDRLIEKYQRRAVAVAYRLLGNLDDAMEVVQDAFLRAFRSLATLEEPRRFGAWLMRIVSNLSLNFRRGRKLTLSLSGDEDESEGLASRLAVNSETGGDRLHAGEMQQAISVAVGALPPQQRLALVLFALEGIPQKEVAEIMECSVEMVKWNVFQARKTLKEKLAEFLDE